MSEFIFYLGIGDGCDNFGLQAKRWLTEATMAY